MEHVHTSIYYASLAQKDLDANDLGGALFWFLQYRAVLRGDWWAAVPLRNPLSTKWHISPAVRYLRKAQRERERDLILGLKFIGHLDTDAITQNMRDAYWYQYDLGQGHEDAGGYKIRCLCAFAGLTIPERGEGVQDVIDRLMEQPQ